MKKWVITAVILLTIGLIGVGATLWNGKGFDYSSVEINQDQSIDAGGVKDIVLSMDGMDVTMAKSSTNEIKVFLTGKASKKLADATKLNIVREGDAVRIGVDTKASTFGISVFELQARVELPAQQYDSLVLNTESGNLNMAEFAAQSVRIKSYSGKIKLDGVTASTVSLELGSGDAEINHVSADTVELNGKYANVTLEKLTAQKLKVKTGSGGISMRDVEAELELEADSAKIEATMADIAHPMKITTGSGDVTLYTAERPSSATIKFSHGSGKLHNEWDKQDQPNADKQETILLGDGGVSVDIKTGSGNLTLAKR